MPDQTWPLNRNKGSSRLTVDSSLEFYSSLFVFRDMIRCVYLFFFKKKGKCLNAFSAAFPKANN